MADASAHDKQMEDFMRAKMSMLGIENRKFQSIDNTSCRIDNAAGKQP